MEGVVWEGVQTLVADWAWRGFSCTGSEEAQRAIDRAYALWTRGAELELAAAGHPGGGTLGGPREYKQVPLAGDRSGVWPMD